MKSRKLKKVFGVLVATFWLSYCASDEDRAGAGQEQLAVTIPFAAKVKGSPFSCTANYSGIGAKSGGGSTISPRDFRFYVHDVILLTDQAEELTLELIQDGQWQYQNVALLDFEDGTGSCATTSGPTPAVNHTMQGSIAKPKGVVNQIRFRLGVPVSLNHNDRAASPPPLNIAALHWNWTTGYKFARLDFTSPDFVSGTNTAGLFNIHLGSVDCTGDGAQGTASCATEYRPLITLSYTLGQTIVADLGELLHDTDLSVPNQFGPNGCMSGRSDPECVVILNNLGLDVYYTGGAYRGLTAGSTSSPVHYPSNGQKFFKVE